MMAGATRTEQLERALLRLIEEASSALEILNQKSTADDHDAGEMAICARLAKAIDAAKKLIP